MKLFILYLLNNIMYYMFYFANVKTLQNRTFTEKLNFIVSLQRNIMKKLCNENVQDVANKYFNGILHNTLNRKF